jgi:hypothetical protein
MPVAVPAIVATAQVFATGTTLFGLSVAGTALLAGVSSFAISALTGALAPKPKAPNLGTFSASAGNRTMQVRQAITARRVLYGEARVSGAVVYAASTSNNTYLHLIIVLAAHEIEAIDEVWVGENIVPSDWLDASGNVTTGRFAGKLRIKKYLGGDGQTADPDLVAEVSEWTSAHRGRGHAYLYLRLKKDRNTWPTGAPNFSAVVRGKKIFDSRIGQSRWTPNGALLAFDWLTDTPYGVGAAAADVDTDTVEVAANACDEIVTVADADTVVTEVAASTDMLTLGGDRLMVQRGDWVRLTTTGSAPGGLAVDTDYYVIPYQFGGTPRIKLAATLDDAITGTAIDITSAGSGTHTIRKTGEPRYYGGGMIETDKPLGENMYDILTAMGGTLVNIGGMWSLFAAVWRAPALTLNEDHVRAPLKINTSVSRKDRYNTVKGVYSGPLNDWQPADYPVVTSSTYVDADNGERLSRDYDLPFTQRPHTAQRLAKIRLERDRREISLEYPAKFRGIQFIPCDTVSLDNDRAGWSAKSFEVHACQIVRDGLALGVDLSLRETDSAIYNWSSSEEGGITPAARTNSPNPFDISAPVGLSIDSIKIDTAASDKIYRVVLGWQPYADGYVTEGGSFQIQYKKSDSAVWIPTGINPDGDDTSADVFSGELGTDYDIRIRAVNSLRVASEWSTFSGFVVGTAGGVTSTEDYGNWTESLGSTLDYGNWTESLGSTLDYGGFST